MPLRRGPGRARLSADYAAAVRRAAVDGGIRGEYGAIDLRAVVRDMDRIGADRRTTAAITDAANGGRRATKAATTTGWSEAPVPAPGSGDPVERPPAARSGTDGPRSPVDPPKNAGSGQAEEPKRGRVDRSKVKRILQHELDTAYRLASLGHDIEFRPIEVATDAADVLIDGSKWDFKSPLSAVRTTISKRVVDELEVQGGQVVLDLTRSPMSHNDGVDPAKDLLRRYDALESVWLIKQAGKNVESVVLDKEAWS